MTWLTRAQIKEFVKNALLEVADFNGDIENYNFNNFHDFHKRIFIDSIMKQMSIKGFRIDLRIDKLDEFSNLGKLIDFITKRQVYENDTQQKITL
jgi:hypothetical protein